MPFSSTFLCKVLQGTNYTVACLVISTRWSDMLVTMATYNKMLFHYLRYIKNKQTKITVLNLSPSLQKSNPMEQKRRKGNLAAIQWEQLGYRCWHKKHLIVDLKQFLTGSESLSLRNSSKMDCAVYISSAVLAHLYTQNRGPFHSL